MIQMEAVMCISNRIMRHVNPIHFKHSVRYFAIVSKNLLFYITLININCNFRQMKRVVPICLLSSKNTLDVPSSINFTVGNASYILHRARDLELS